MSYYVYIISNYKQTPLYVGVTNDLVRRMFEHQHKLIKGFSRKYNLNILLYWEQTDDIIAAIIREKQFKNWHRPWKLRLISSINQDFVDLTKYSGCRMVDPETSSG